MEVIEGHAERIDEIPVAEAQIVPDYGGWNGDCPFYLQLDPDEDPEHFGNLGIDVDTSGWIEGNRENFRRPGLWFLMLKSANPTPVLAIKTFEGDQFYYSRHHVGSFRDTWSAEGTCHVIGVKRADGHVDRLWLLPNGMVMSGEEQDVDNVALRML